MCNVMHPKAIFSPQGLTKVCIYMLLAVRTDCNLGHTYAICSPQGDFLFD